MFNGSHLPTFTLPVPVYDGQEFLFRNLATTATTGNILNTNMRAPTLVEPNAGAFFRAVSTSV